MFAIKFDIDVSVRNDIKVITRIDVEVRVEFHMELGVEFTVNQMLNQLTLHREHIIGKHHCPL